MINRFLKKYQPSVLISILVLGILLFLKAILFNADLNQQNMSVAMPLFLLLKSLLGTSSIAYIILALVLFIFFTNYLVRLNLKYFFIEERTYLPAFFYFIFVSVLYLVTGFHPAIIGVLFLLIIIDKLLFTGEQEKKLANYFDIGLLMGVGSLFYANLTVYLLFIIIALIVLNSFNIRRLVILILGMLTVYFSAWFYYYFFGQISDFTDIIQANLLTESLPESYHYSSIIFGSLIALIVIVASLNLLFRFNQKKIIARKYFNVFNFLMAFTLACLLLISGFSISILYILFIPVSFILADFFVHLKSRLFKEILYSILLAIILFAIIFYPL